MLLNNYWVNENIKGVINKYLKTSKNKIWQKYMRCNKNNIKKEVHSNIDPAQETRKVSNTQSNLHIRK